MGLCGHRNGDFVCSKLPDHPGKHYHSIHSPQVEVQIRDSAERQDARHLIDGILDAKSTLDDFTELVAGMKVREAQILHAALVEEERELTQRLAIGSQMKNRIRQSVA
jgi:hypothetical protein